MKRYRGYFLYYKKGQLKQHSFRNATHEQVRSWYNIFTNKEVYRYRGEKIASEPQPYNP